MDAPLRQATFILPAALLLAACTTPPSPAAPTPSAGAASASPSATSAPSPQPSSMPSLTPARIAPFNAAGSALTTSGVAMLAVVCNPSGQSSHFTLNAAAPSAPYRAQPAETAPAPAWPALPRFSLQQTTAPVVGSTSQFWINAGDFNPADDHPQTATLQRITGDAFFYVDNATSVSSADLDALSMEFENNIYPKVTAAFGRESRPGVDNDSHIYIVISPIVGQSSDLLAYFWARDAVPAAQAEPHSNGHEILFLSSKMFGHSHLLVYGSLAHEFQHLINFSRKGPRLNYQGKEERWLDEGMAMLAEDVAGYGLGQGEQVVANSIRAFENDPGAYSLTDWDNNPNAEAFGEDYLFVRYLVDRYGWDVLSQLIDSDQTGIPNVNRVLEARGQHFADFFRDWELTNLISGTPAAAGTPYQYNGVNLTGLYGPIQLPGFKTTTAQGTPLSGTLRPWGAQFYRFTAPAPQNWRVTVSADQPLTGAAIAP